MIHKLNAAGERHIGMSLECEDVLFSGANRKYTVISLADGVSSCRKAKEGAEIAGSAVADFLLVKGDHFMEMNNNEVSEKLLSHITYRINSRAQEENGSTDDYSSTVAAALYDKKNKKLLFFNLGDGIIITSGKNGIRVVANPSDSTMGCCVTTTKGAKYGTETDIIDTRELDTVMICSDGAWRAMYSGNHMKKEVFEYISEKRYDKLKKYLREQKCRDDFSFISMDIPS